MKLLRYDDPVLGPRRLPNLDGFYDGKSAIEAGDTFAVDNDKRLVTLRRASDACDVPVGSQLVYVVS